MYNSTGFLYFNISIKGLSQRKWPLFLNPESDAIHPISLFALAERMLRAAFG